MDLVQGQNLHGFTVLTAEPLPEIDGTAYTLLHNVSGAKLLYLQNDDDNKAFSIAFRTPPADDTGVFHILEHSVLCGSEKFPVKEPFVNLLKTSMQTFLNAMTFGDKTLYPVASTNDQDLMNLADVYMDAVLHPDIYRKRQVFEQEGWHYELVAADEAGEDEAGADSEGAGAGAAARPQLAYNGVVYNEMKGALSDASSVLYDQLQASLFPDTPYAFESGGTPEAIPTLTYEHYLEEHERHYRLDNSYLTLYGNVDLDRMLAFLDERYLTPVAAEQAKRAGEREAAGLAPLEPRTLPEQAPVCALGVRRTMTTAPENACMGLGYVIGHVRERTRIVACDILLDAIAGSNEAPLKRALLDAGLAGDVQAYLADSVQQPFAVIQLRGLGEDAHERFRTVVNDELSRLAAGGLDHALVEASLSRAEFVMRERDFGVADGVALTMSALCGWLYDDALATTYLRYEDDFAYLRRALDQGYFEELIRSVFLESRHMAEVEVVPVKQADDGEAARLAAVAESFAPEDFARVEAEVAELRRLQETPDSPEALATLPQLTVADIGPAPVEPAYGLVEGTPVPCIRHTLPTRGLAYAYRYFDMSALAFENLPYVAVLGIVLGKLATGSHTASEIDTLTNGKLGNFSVFCEIYEDEADPATFRPVFVAGASALAENIDWLAKLPGEILASTQFTDTGKIRDALKQRRIGMEQSFANAGHSAAMARLTSYFLPASVVRQQLGGVGFYQFLKVLLEHFDERADDLVKRLGEVSRKLFGAENLTVSFAGGDAEFARFWECADICAPEDKRPAAALAVPEPKVLNEAFIVPTDVCYVACGYDRRALGAPYTGAWQIASRVLSYDYLWNEVRVKGGAYGAGFQAVRSGTVRFYSYRDPHLDETLARMNATPAWLAAFEPTREEMDGYIVSTVAGFDTPLKARMLVRRQDGDFFSRRSPEARRETRQQMIDATPEQLHQLAGTIEGVLAKGALCVFGNKEIIESAKADLHVVDLLNE